MLLKLFCAEAMVLNRLKHSNILPLYCVCVSEFAPRCALVSPLMKNGHTLDFLEKNPSTDRLNIVCAPSQLS